MGGDFDSKGHDDPYEVEMGVEKVFVHTNYSVYTSMDQDFALLKLKEPMPIGPCIGVACLPEPDHVPSSATEGERCNITGWGTMQFMGSGLPRKLQQAPVSILSNEECQAAYGNATITAAMICASGFTDEGITDSCQGDSGGPLVCKERGRYILRGVTSWGEGCADVSFPGVYSRVSTQLEWIHAVMAGRLPEPSTEPGPSNYNGSMWIVTEGPCQMDEQHCITSPNYPKNYSNDESCKIAVNVSAAVPLDVKEFATEAWYDQFVIGCQEFSGAVTPQGVTPSGDITWASDGSVTDVGWKICPSSGDTTVLYP